MLAVGGEKMTHLDTPRVSELISRSIDPYERSYGATMPALAGLVARALMAQGLGARELAQVSVKNHRHGAWNPRAQYQRPVTVEEVLKSRPIAEPRANSRPPAPGRMRRSTPNRKKRTAKCMQDSMPQL